MAKKQIREVRKREQMMDSPRLGRIKTKVRITGKTNREAVTNEIANTKKSIAQEILG